MVPKKKQFVIEQISLFSGFFFPFFFFFPTLVISTNTYPREVKGTCVDDFFSFLLWYCRGVRSSVLISWRLFFVVVVVVVGWVVGWVDTSIKKSKKSQKKLKSSGEHCFYPYIHTYYIHTHSLLLLPRRRRHRLPVSDVIKTRRENIDHRRPIDV